MLLILTALACTEPAAVESDAPAEAGATTEPAATAPTPTEAPPAADLEPVRIVGYGVRFELNPPFQVTRWPRGESGSADQLALSVWDMSAEDVGSNPTAGLHTLYARPGEPAEGAEPIRTVETDDEGHTTVLWSMGVGGTTLTLPAGVDAVPQVRMRAGPAAKEWAIVAGGTTSPWPEATWLHSADPASGRAFRMDPRPIRPWFPEG